MRKPTVVELIEHLRALTIEVLDSMKMENGATFGEFVVLRALRVRGGEAPFAELSKIDLRCSESF
jgi:hypothetical protein